MQIFTGAGGEIFVKHRQIWGQYFSRLLHVQAYIGVLA